MDWRCAESVDNKDEWTAERRANVSLETHEVDNGHGDVCRSTVSTDYFCPGRSMKPDWFTKIN